MALWDNKSVTQSGGKNTTRRQERAPAFDQPREGWKERNPDLRLDQNTWDNKLTTPVKEQYIAAFYHHEDPNKDQSKWSLNAPAPEQYKTLVTFEKKSKAIADEQWKDGQETPEREQARKDADAFNLLLERLQTRLSPDELEVTGIPQDRLHKPQPKPELITLSQNPQEVNEGIAIQHGQKRKSNKFVKKAVLALSLGGGGVAGILGFNPGLRDQVVQSVTKWGDKALQPSGQEADEGSSGIILKSELTNLWLHPALLELAKAPSDSEALRSPEALENYLKKQGAEKAWYAYITQNKLMNGDVSQSTIFKYANDVSRFEELKDILEITAGKPPRHFKADTANVDVNSIPENLLAVPPLGAIVELKKSLASIASGRVR